MTLKVEAIIKMVKEGKTVRTKTNHKLAVTEHCGNDVLVAVINGGRGKSFTHVNDEDLADIEV